MDDKQAKNSWDDLLQDLGAKPDESAFERHQAPAQEIPPTVEWSEAEEADSETEASPGDWVSLAESLGLEVDEPPEPVEEPVVAKDEPPIVAEVKEADVKEPVAEEAVEKVVETDEPFGGFTAPEKSSFVVEEDEEEEDTEEYSEDDDVDDYDDEEASYDDEEASTSDDELPPLPSPMDQALSETAWDDESEDEKSEAAADDDSDSSGISGEAARSAFDALFSDGASGWGSAFLQKSKKENSPRAAKRELVDDTVDAELSESLDATTDGGDEEETERPKRKRSRRRRRGGRGRKSAAQQTADGEATEEQSSADQEELSEEDSTEEKKRRPRRRRSGQRSRPVEASDESTLDEQSLDDTEEAATDRPRSAGRGRQLHRNLPTWSDAIGMIVDANLEQRAKSPSKPQSSRGGRGGRGRRRKSSEST